MIGLRDLKHTITNRTDPTGNFVCVFSQMEKNFASKILICQVSNTRKDVIQSLNMMKSMENFSVTTLTVTAGSSGKASKLT